MNANERESEELDSLVEGVVGAAIEVSNVLGSGFLEKVYERAMLKELALRGIAAKAQVPFAIVYKGQLIGDYLADILVDDRLVIELKCVDQFANEHMAQCINYLKASGRKIALLINFQKPKMEWKRIVYKL
jgi:GxxExxY protein